MIDEEEIIAEKEKKKSRAIQYQIWMLWIAFNYLQHSSDIKTNASVISGMKDLQCQIQRKRIASLKQPTLETFYKNWIIYYIYILKQFVLAHSMQIKSTFIIYYYDKSDTSLSRTQESAPTSPTYRVCLCSWYVFQSANTKASLAP